MPRATVSTESVRKDLKTCSGAYVVLRPMGFGEYLQRRDLALKMSMEARSKNQKVNIETIQTEVAAYQLRVCVVEHNLEDASGRTLNLGSAADLAQLDPKVGQEIGRYIDELNEFEEEESSLFRED